jgi:tetratricopeptide (TPR) repeat protein
LAALAAPRGMADLTSFPARHRLTQLEARGQLPSAAEWNEARERLQRALELDPQNPVHYELLARWYERYSLRLPRASAIGAAYLEQSAAHLRRALAERPASARTWAHLATVKLRLAQFDAELDAAVTRAWRFGPREQEVQWALARISGPAGERLGPAARQAAHAAMTLVCTAPETEIKARHTDCYR